MAALARLATLLILALLVTSCASMSSSGDDYSEGSDPYADLSLDDDALLSKKDFEVPTDLDVGKSTKKVEEELTLEDDKKEIDQNDIKQEISKKIAEKVIDRAPASVVSLVPRASKGGSIVYTPLWIKIPLGECLEIVKNANYDNGACIKRRQ